MKILLLSEAPLCVNGGGIAQTLYNIFSFSNEKDILSVVPKSFIQLFPPTYPYNSSYIAYTFEIIKPLQNRLGKYVNPYIDWLNYSLNQYRSFKLLKGRIDAFQPDVIVSCPNGPIGVFMHEKLLKDNKANVFPYFMDDWMYKSEFTWLGGSLHTLIKRMLSSHGRWMMISLELGELLQERYDIVAEEILVLHNPINLNNAPANRPLLKKAEYLFAYAGALWPMHFDAFLSLAKALRLVNNTIPVKLKLYTAESFWKWRKEELEGYPIVYEGSVAYENIHAILNQADILIVTSSFLSDYYTHTKASVQTKITDYLKSRKLVISVGPSYSANNNFIKSHQCGLCIETNDPLTISENITNFLYEIDSYQHLVENGWILLNTQFAFEKVHCKLHDFLNN